MSAHRNDDVEGCVDSRGCRFQPIGYTHEPAIITSNYYTNNSQVAEYTSTSTCIIELH